MLKVLQGLLDEGTCLEHLNDYFAAGTYDDVWIPKLSKDPRWIVITSDRAKRGGTRGGKLPELLKRNCIRHIVMSAALHNKSGVEKVSVLVMMWDKILEVRKAKPGSRFLLRYMAQPSDKSRLVVDLVPADTVKRKGKTFFEEMKQDEDSSEQRP